jgi:prepilin-type N-terminal cleavage/methylation domain-containing protein
MKMIVKMVPPPTDRNNWKRKGRNKSTRSGFTLIEVIVVLVILAILAAIAIPALTGYIDKTKNKEMIQETRTAITAMQTIATELYAEGDKNSSRNDFPFVSNPESDLADKNWGGLINRYVGSAMFDDLTPELNGKPYVLDSEVVNGELTRVLIAFPGKGACSWLRSTNQYRTTSKWDIFNDEGWPSVEGWDDLGL